MEFVFVEFVDSDGGPTALRLDLIQAVTVAKGAVSLVTGAGARVHLRGTYEETMAILRKACGGRPAHPDNGGGPDYHDAVELADDNEPYKSLLVLVKAAGLPRGANRFAMAGDGPEYSGPGFFVYALYPHNTEGYLFHIVTDGGKDTIEYLPGAIEFLKKLV